MVTTEIKYAILLDATEGCTSLWDAVWETVDYSNGRGADDRALRERQYENAISDAQSVIRELYTSGLIMLYKGNNWGGSLEQERVVPEAEVEATLSNRKYWELPSEESVPENEEYICFYETQLGRQIYRQGKEALETFLR